MLAQFFGRLHEDTDAMIGIEEDKFPSYYGRCRVCSWKTVRCGVEADAQHDLQVHVESKEHRDKIQRAAIQNFEEKITAHQGFN